MLTDSFVFGVAVTAVISAAFGGGMSRERAASTQLAVATVVIALLSGLLFFVWALTSFGG